jgi:hypothetical protein
MNKSGFFQEQGQWYDKFGRKVTPKQVLGLEDLFTETPQNKQVMQAAMDVGLIPQQQKIPVTTLQERPKEAKFEKPKNAFNRGALDTSEDGGPPKTPEKAKQDLLDYLNKHPDDIEDIYNDFDGKAPNWIKNLYEYWEHDKKGRPQLMSKSAGRPKKANFGKGRPDVLPITQLELPESKDVIPIAGILNTIIDRERRR